MKFHILTLFPDMVMQGLMTSITGRAVQKNKIGIEAVNIRDYARDKHKKVDDYPYGGGAGMLMQAQPVYDAWKDINDRIGGKKPVRTIYVTPQGHTFHQKMAEDFAREEELVILCGHYEGIDERVLEEIVTDYVSIGDYVLTGGELAAMVMVDAISRLVPGVLNNEVSAETESFHGDLLEYPQYSRPEVWMGKAVPEVLLTGNEKKIRQWRLERSIERTKMRRPDLYRKYQKLQQCKNLMMKQKLLHIDMIELINRGRAELLFMEGMEILLRETQTGLCFHTKMDAPDRAGEELSGANDRSHLTTAELQFLRELDPSILQEICSIVVHQESCRDYLEEYFGKRTTCVCYQAVCTRREQLPVTGLYRADGRPVESGVNQGMQIRQVTMEYLPLVADTYHLVSDDRYVRDRIAAGAVYGAFFGETLAGFIAFHEEGSIGMLEVLPAYRNRNIATALETYIMNLAIRQGMIPYGQIIEGNEASTKLQEKMGLYLSRTPVYWMAEKEKNS